MTILDASSFDPNTNIIPPDRGCPEILLRPSSIGANTIDAPFSLLETRDNLNIIIRHPDLQRYFECEEPRELFAWTTMVPETELNEFSLLEPLLVRTRFFEEPVWVPLTSTLKYTPLICCRFRSLSCERRTCNVYTFRNRMTKDRYWFRSYSKDGKLSIQPGRLPKARFEVRFGLVGTTQ